MRLIVNGAVRDVAAGTTVAALVAELVATERGIAVSVDRAIVPRSEWTSHTLREGASVEVLAAAAGG